MKDQEHTEEQFTSVRYVEPSISHKYTDFKNLTKVFDGNLCNQFYLLSWQCKYTQYLATISSNIEI